MSHTLPKGGGADLSCSHFSFKLQCTRAPKLGWCDYLSVMFLHPVASVKACTDGGTNQVHRIVGDQPER